ncbi:hypothetical protein ACU5AY_09260 [Rhizobium sp. PAMB 3174]
MKDDIVSSGSIMPRIAEALPLENRLVRYRLSTGETGVVDLAPALESRRIYQRLRKDDALFQSLRVSEFGDALEWDGDLEFSALWLLRLPPVEFDNEDFRRAMDDLHMTLDGMAAALDISRRQVASYRKDKPVPRNIAYAVRFLLEHQAKVA